MSCRPQYDPSSQKRKTNYAHLIGGVNPKGYVLGLPEVGGERGHDSNEAHSSGEEGRSQEANM